jgi:hypothetical protein
VADDIAKQQAAIADQCVRNGIATDSEICKGQQAQAASQTQLSVLNQLFASGQNATGKQWFEEHQDQLQGEDRAHAERMVRIGTDQDQARSIADDVLAKAHAGAMDDTGVVDQSKLSLESALQDLEDRHIADTGVYDQAKSRIVQMFKLSQEAHKEVQVDTMQAVVDHLTGDNNPAHNEPVDLMAKLDPSNRMKMLKVQKQLRLDQVPKTDDALWNDLQSAYKDDKQWSEMPAPVTVRADLNPRDYTRYEKMYAEAQGKASRKDDTLSQGMVSTAAVDRIWIDNGMPKMPKAPAPGQPATPDYQAAAARKNRFSEQLYRLVGAEQVKLKRDLTPPEIDEQAKKLFAQQTWQHESDGFWDVLLGRGDASKAGPQRRDITDTGYAFEAPGADKRAYSIRDVPLADRDRLATDAKKRGAIVTEANLVEAYNREVATAAAKASRAAP